MYELSDRRIEKALAVAATRGVSVRVILDRRGYEPGRENPIAVSYLRAHGVQTRYAPQRFALDHEKALIVDRHRALIMTLNLTPEYYASDRDFIVADERHADVAEIEARFDRDWAAARHAASVHATEEASPQAGAAAPPRLVFSPGAAPRLLALIASARHAVQLESEELDDHRVVSALCADARRGVSVEVTMTYQRASQPSLLDIEHCGGSVHLYPPNASLYIHAKAIVVDRRVAFVGSQNLSAQSLDYDRELGIVFTAATLVRSLSHTLAADFAQARVLHRDRSRVYSAR